MKSAPATAQDRLQKTADEEYAATGYLCDLCGEPIERGKSRLYLIGRTVGHLCGRCGK